MTFHLTRVFILFLVRFGLLDGRLFWEIAAHSVDHILSLYFDFLWVRLFPVLVLGAGFWFWLLRFLIFAYFLLLRQCRFLLIIQMYG